MNALAHTLAVAALAGLTACAESAAPAPLLPVQASHRLPASTSAQLELAGVVTRGTSQFGALLVGEYDVAADAGAPLALHLRLSNLGPAPLQYQATDDAGEDPLFTAERFLRDRWREVELGFCATGLHLPSVAPGASRDLYLPLPLAAEAHRFSIPLMNAGATCFTEVAVVTWDPATLPPRAGSK